MRKRTEFKQDVEKQHAPKKKRTRTIWVKDCLSRREIFGHYDQLLTELHREDPKSFRNH